MQETARTIGMLAAGLVCVGSLGAAFVLFKRPERPRGRTVSPEAVAISSLRTIGDAQAIFREGDKDGDEVYAYGTLEQLLATQLVDEELGSGAKRGYVFEAAPSTTSSEFLWFAVASPQEPGVAGDRYFCTNQAGVIYYTTSAPIPLNTTTCEIPSHLVPVGR